jgi:hypothetical protein
MLLKNLHIFSAYLTKPLMKKIILSIYIVASLLIIGVLFFNYHLDKKFRQQVAFDRSNEDAVAYFNEICLGSEFGGPQVTRKWKTEMRLYIVKDSSYTMQVATIKKVVNDANKLFSDGFKITVINDSAKANAYLVLTSDKKLKSYYRFKDDFKVVDSNFFGYFKNTAIRYCIQKSSIFINTSKPAVMQKDAIIEEIIQSLGMGNDSEIYSNSIFYQHKYDLKCITPNASKLDKQVIKLLYDPKMQLGLNRLRTVPIIREILNTTREI